MDKFPDVPAAPSASASGERPAISSARNSSAGGRAGIGLLPVLMAALFSGFCLNALAAGTQVPADDQSAVTHDSDSAQREEMREHWEKMSPEERKQIRARMQEHWEKMSPEQREVRRKEMREHFKNMSPQERQQFKSDMDIIDGFPPSGSGYPGGKGDAAASSTKG